MCTPEVVQRRSLIGCGLTLLSSSSSPLPPALQCYCDRCSANSSCVTDGVCFVAIRKSGSHQTTERRQCVHEKELIPRDRPFICAPSVKHDTGIYPMCCTTDYCNKESEIPGKQTTNHGQTGSAVTPTSLIPPFSNDRGFVHT